MKTTIASLVLSTCFIGYLDALLMAQQKPEVPQNKAEEKEMVLGLLEFEEVFQQAASSSGLSDQEATALLGDFKAENARRQIGVFDLRTLLLETLYQRNTPYPVAKKFLSYLADRLRRYNTIDTGFLESLRQVNLQDRVVYKVGENGITEPKLIYRSLPPYTEAARRLRIEGSILLQAIVMEDGSVANLKVLHGLGYGLDESAVLTVQGWKFLPASLEGRPVPVQTKIEVSFRLL
jgi:TonB family protein